MASVKLQNVSISGLVTAVPKEITNSDSYATRFSSDEIAKVSKLTGVHERRIASAKTLTSDLCVEAVNRLLSRLEWEPSSVDLVIFVSQTPDYVLPATSCVIHERVGLAPHAVAFDINLGCSGYVYGLWAAANAISGGSIRRGLLLVGDTISKTVNPHDRATALLFGDAGSATALEFDKGAPEISFVLGTDGTGWRNLIIRNGGWRNRPMQSNPNRAGDDIDPGDFLYMDGSEIFNFTLRTVPALVTQLLGFTGLSADDIDYFLFHQANEFMISHIGKKLKLRPDKVPMNISRFGNTSSASIPLLVATELSDEINRSVRKTVMAGFGVGYSWGAALVELGPVKCAELLEV